MGRLIADSGSTKADWVLLENDKRASFSTAGFNPFFVDSTRVEDELKSDLIPDLADATDINSITEVHFYGAGCSSNERCEVIAKALRHLFPEAGIFVEHDLLAAARALCGREAGIAAILGTGSNSCYYNGQEIVRNITALGYILGDEGSGGHMGRKLIKVYLNNEMPEELSKAFNKEYDLSTNDILTAVYSKTLPNRFLAGFSKFLSNHIDHEFCVETVNACLNKFFDRHICKYDQHKELPLHIVGSVGYIFVEQLKQIAASRGIALGRVLKSPLEGLVEYHSDHGVIKIG